MSNNITIPSQTSMEFSALRSQLFIGDRCSIVRFIFAVTPIIGSEVYITENFVGLDVGF